MSNPQSPESTTNTLTKILIVNQHGDNRGDEAAMRAMLEGLESRLGPTKFTIFHQFNTPESSCVETGSDVTYMPLRVSVPTALRLGIWAVLTAIGIRFDPIAGKTGSKMLSHYEEADLVISAPGGPYFGDLYVDHEIVHWFYVWVARILKRPIALYAPSCGPFKNRIMNPIRKRGFTWFDAITLRESVSQGFLSEFTDGKITPEVTADSAFQSRVPASTDLIDTSGGVDFHVVVAVRQPEETEQVRHDSSVVAAMEAIAKRHKARFYLLPQLHGNRTKDRPYLLELQTRAGKDLDTVVLTEDHDSFAQRGLVGAADMVIGGRYHPGVFAVSAHTPAFIIPYEHKARGMAEAAEVGKWAIDLADLNPTNAVDTTNDILDNLEKIREILVRTEPAMYERSSRTSVVTTEVLLGPSER